MGAPSSIESEVDAPSQPQPQPALKGTLRLLFSTLPRRFYPLIGVAILLSLASGGLPPLMTKVLGDAFNAYTAFNPQGLPAAQISQAARDQLMRSILRSVWQLCALAGGTMLLSTAMTTAWIAVGERTASALRQKVYRACDAKSMSWFDQGLAGTEGETGSIGAGGLMARFAREVDDVRVAVSQTSGQLLQHITTMIACTVLALVSRWDLTLIILASIPLTAILTIATEVMAAKPIGEERALTAHASGGVERCVNAIMTIKAFNAAPRELERFNTFLAAVARVNLKMAVVWSARIGISSTLTLAMFTAGFAYGSHLVQAGKCSPGTVVTVFWSALTASAQLQLVIQSLNVLEKGKIASASLQVLCDSEAPDVAGKAAELIPARGNARPRTKSRQSHNIVPMGKIRPARCHGEVVMQKVTFAYPSRPHVHVLRNVTLYLAAGESTYIVGGSGSGKSTIAQLLLRLYTQYSGSMEIDEQDVRYLDASWVRANVASVDQSPIVFDLSVHDNVALGLCGVSGGDAGAGPDHVPFVSRDDVVAACRTALLHDFIQSLPDGYDTQLGARGASLSGGQKQRLSIARAKIRNPPILILDEATSALDPTSRLLVNEAVKSWRRGKTTIIITHDLSSVGDDDFLYLMQDGQVAQQGYRSDLEGRQGPFQRLIQLQQQQPSEKEGLTPSPTGLEVRAERAVSTLQFDVEKGVAEQISTQDAAEPHSRTAHWARRLSGNPMESMNMPIVDSAAGGANSTAAQSGGVGGLAGYVNATKHHQRTVSVAASTTSSTVSYARGGGLRPLRLAEKQQQRAVEQEEGAVEWLTSASEAVSKRRPLRDSTSTDGTQSPPPRRRWSVSELSMDSNEGSRAPRSRKGSTTSSISHAEGAKEHVIDMSEKEEQDAPVAREDRPGASLYRTLLASWKAQPHKVLLIVGLLTCIAAGIITPVFSFVLGKLLATMGRQNQGNEVTQYALIVLGLAFLDGILNFFRFLIMDWCADQWVRKLRERAYAQVLGQDKAWFDKPNSAAGPIVTSIVKDADDAQALVGRIMGQLLMIVAMVSAGLIWAMITGWQLTLVGLAFGPVFIIAMTLQSRIVTRHEVRNKAKREAVAKRFYDMVSNVRGIRSMALEPVFDANFLDATLEAERCALRAAPYAGFGFGLGEALTYAAEALLYYVGAVLIVKGTYDFERMVIVLNLIIFAVTFAGNVMAFLPGLSKSIQAASDLDSLVHLPANASSELQGHATPQIRGGVAFDNVHFAYPLRSDVPVLRGISFSIARGERVALVGGSGSGKSTVAALLQRLYEPAAGQVTLDGRPLGSIDVRFLREHMAVVSQHPNLFDVSVADNIAYGASAHLVATGGAVHSVDRSDVERAAREAQADEFVRALPDAYDTVLGENASLISGGQAQRLAIARALVRQRARILVLDECTSALDAATQASVADALLEGETKRRDLTTLIVTHKVQLMQRCDRILVLEHGKVVEQGHYDELIKRRGGAFAQLASAGEWGM